MLVCAGITAAALVIPCSASAYVDPGAGSIAVQIALGILAGILVIIRLAMHRLKALFSRFRGRRATRR